MRKKLLSIALTLAVVFSSMSFGTAVAYADGPGDFPCDGIYNGQYCSDDKNAAALVDYIMAKYKENTLFPLPGECWGYAEKVNTLLSKENQTDYFEDLELTRENFMEKCLGVMAGTHIRLNKAPKFDSWTGHSIVLLSVTDDLICWADNNYSPYNTVHYNWGTFDDFYNMYGHYGWLTMVSQPVKFKVYKTPLVVSAVDEATGKVKLNWLKASGTTRYEVYRSESKDGDYKRLYRGVGKTYTDKSAAPGVKYYYKIKAEKKSGDVFSGRACRTAKLNQPIVTAGNDINGNIQLTWLPVEKADKYYVYRYSDETGTYKKVKTVTDGTTYTDKVTEGGATYKVKAIYSANTYGNSCYSKETYGWKLW